MAHTMEGDGAGLPDPGMAAAALASADQAQAAVRQGSGWTSKYLVAYGVASIVFMLVVSLSGLQGPEAAVAAAVGGCVLWFVFVAVARRYSRRQPVRQRGYHQVIGWSFLVWLVLWVAAWVLGSIYFDKQLAFWVPAAAVVAAPLFLGAHRAAAVRR